MNGMERVRKTVFEFSFAGFGGDGPGGALATMKMLRRWTVVQLWCMAALVVGTVKRGGIFHVVFLCQILDSSFENGGEAFEQPG